MLDKINIYRVVKVETLDKPSFCFDELDQYTQDFLMEQYEAFEYGGGIIKLTKMDVEMFITELEAELPEKSIQLTKQNLEAILDEMGDKEYILYVVEEEK